MRISDWSSDVALPICYRVVLAGRSAEKVEASAAELQADRGQARALVGDASQDEDAATFAAAAEAWAPLAVAVHNAGTNHRDSFLDLHVAHFEQLRLTLSLVPFLPACSAAHALFPRLAPLTLFPAATRHLFR